MKKELFLSIITSLFLTSGFATDNLMPDVYPEDPWAAVNAPGVGIGIADEDEEIFATSGTLASIQTHVYGSNRKRTS